MFLPLHIVGIHIVSINRNFYQNRFISENPVVSESQSFLVKYRRTYVLKNIFLILLNGRIISFPYK